MQQARQTFLEFPLIALLSLVPNSSSDFSANNDAFA
jgi:hypothetical protein